MLEKLNKKQLLLMEEVKKGWLNRFYNYKPINKDLAIRQIKWLYKFCNLKEPEIIFVSSPLVIQYTCNMFKREQVEGQVREQVREQVEGQVRGQVWGQVEGQKLEFYEFCWYGDVWDYGWVSFYNFFEKISIVKDKEFTQFKNLLKSNIYTMVQFDGLCIVCELPYKINIDDQNKLHSLEKPAIKWKDGYELYYINGVSFDKKLWQKVKSKKMSLKEILQIKNIEQRMCVLKYNSEKLLDKAELLDKSERGNELYLVKDIFSEPAYFLKYECPSTGRVYVSGIDPQFVKENQDADTCMAWKHNWSFKEYYKLKIES